MKILFVGDVVGKPGRDAILKLLPGLRAEVSADFVIVNGENAASGIGITREIAREMLEKGGADAITLGNHAFGKRESFNYLDDEPRIVRPANYSAKAPGRGFALIRSVYGMIGVISLQGRVFMEPSDDPFRRADEVLDEIKGQCKIVFVDFHGEATSEKIAFGRYVDGRVSAVVGTHTHVQTADETILPLGTAYLTDVGMTGPIDSVIGMSVDIVLKRFTTQTPTRFEVAEGPAKLCAVLITIDPSNGRASRIERIQLAT